MYKPFDPGKIAPTDANMDIPGLDKVKEVLPDLPEPLDKAIQIITQAGQNIEQETEHFEKNVEKDVNLADIGVHALPEDMDSKGPVDLGYQGVPVELHQDLAAFMVQKNMDLNVWNQLEEEEKKKLLAEFEAGRQDNSDPGIEDEKEEQPSVETTDKMKEFEKQYEGVSLHGSQQAKEKFEKYLGVEVGGEESAVEATDEQKEDVQDIYEQAVTGSVDEEEVQDKIRNNEITGTQGRLCLSVNEVAQKLSSVVGMEQIKDLFGDKVFEYWQTRVDYSPFNPDEAGNLNDLMTRYEGMFKNEKGEWIGSYSQDSMNQNMAKLLEQLGYVAGERMPEDVSAKYVELFREGKLQELANMENIPAEISGYLEQFPEVVQEAGEDLAYAAEVLPKLTDGDMTIFDKLRAYKLWKKEEKWLERAQEGMKGWYEKLGGQSIPLVGAGLGQILESDKPKEVLYELEKTGLEEINKFGLQGVTDVIETLKENGVDRDKIIEFFNNDQYRYLLDTISGVPMNQDDIYNMGAMVEKYQGLLGVSGLSEDMLKDNSEALMFLTGVLHNTPDILERFPNEYFTGDNKLEAEEKWLKGKKDELAV